MSLPELDDRSQRENTTGMLLDWVWFNCANLIASQLCWGGYTKGLMWVLCFSSKGFIFFIPFVGEESGGAFPSSWWNWRIMQCVKVVFYRGWWILHKSRCSIVSERDVGRRRSRSRDVRLERGGFWGSSDEDGRQLRHRNLSAFINCGPLRTRCPLQRARTHSSLDPFSQHHISFSILPMCFYLIKNCTICMI